MIWNAIAHIVTHCNDVFFFLQEPYLRVWVWHRCWLCWSGLLLSILSTPIRHRTIEAISSLFLWQLLLFLWSLLGKSHSHGVRGGHDDVIKWEHFPRHWPSVRGIHQSPENSPHKGQWRGALVFSLIYALINGWVNNRGAADFRRHRGRYNVTVMYRHLWLFLCALLNCPSEHQNERNADCLVDNALSLQYCVVSPTMTLYF